MTWIDLVWPMLASASLLVGFTHVLVWFARPSQGVHLAFAVAALSVGALAIFELEIYRSESPAVMSQMLLWMHVAIACMVLALVYVLHRWFGYGALPIALAAVGLRLLALVLNFSTGENLNFLSVDGVARSTWWGAPISHPTGPTNPMVSVAQASNLLLLVYIAQTLWRAIRQAGPARNAVLIVGGSWFLLVLVMVLTAMQMALGLPRLPVVAAPGFALVVVATSYLLVSELLISQQLIIRLQESELSRLRSEQEVATERECLAHLSRVTMLGELSGSLAHELNQPLTAILSNAQAAQRMLRRDPSHVAEVQEILTDIIENDRRAGQVIERMRGFLRKEANEYAPLAINEVVQDCLRLMRSELIERHVTMQLDLAPTLPHSLGDRIQLQQVLLNLVINACDAMQHMSGERVVRVRTAPSAGGVVTEVSDTGSGIPDAMLERIFAPFETSKSTGMGLGLTVCRTIVQAHGGRIWAEKSAPHGARVCFDLPRQE